MDHNKFPTIVMRNAKTLSAGPEVLLLTMVYNYNLLSPLEEYEIPVLLSMLCMNTNREPDYEEFEKVI